MRVLLRTFTDLDSLYEALETDNEAGGPQFTCFPVRDSNGVPLLASLATSDGESTYVAWIVTQGDSGLAQCSVPDCPANDAISDDWTPRFPVTALLWGADS